MKTKSVVVSSVAVVAASAAAVLKDRDRREKLKRIAMSVRNKLIGEQADLPIKEAAQPDPEDIEKTKMLSEGSIYGVHYYDNKVRQA